MRPITLAVVAFVMIFLGIVLVAVGGISGGNVSSGGVIFIGPVPIIFGSGSNGAILALIALLAGVVMIALTYLYTRRLRTRVGETEPGNT
jgi:uncharacterized membrane protein